MSKCHYVLSIQQNLYALSYLSRLDCGRVSKPSGNMGIYKAYKLHSAFIIAMFDHYKASNLCDDCGH